MAVPYILARTFGDAHAFAQDELGLDKGYYRVVNSTAVLKLRGTELYLVPGWQNRYDRFAMKSALRWTRLTVIDVEEWRKGRPASASEPDGLEPAGEQLTLVDATDFFVSTPPETELVCIAHGGRPARECANIEHGTLMLESAPETDDAHVEAPAEEPKKPANRRRRRCKECGELVHPDDLDQHNAEHLPTEV